MGMTSLASEVNAMVTLLGSAGFPDDDALALALPLAEGLAEALAADGLEVAAVGAAASGASVVDGADGLPPHAASKMQERKTDASVR